MYIDEMVLIVDYVLFSFFSPQKLEIDAIGTMLRLPTTCRDFESYH